MPAPGKRPPSPRSIRPSRPRPTAARRRRTRNGSKRQSAHSSGAATSPAAINCICRRGNTDSRNENVSRSMIRKSRNVSVSCRIPNLKCDSAIRIAMRTSESAAQIAGPLQHDQQETIHEDPRQHGQRDRKRPVFGGQREPQAPPDARQRSGRPAQRTGRRAIARRGFRRFRVPRRLTYPQSPLMKPASINNRLNLRASAPSLQA